MWIFITPTQCDFNLQLSLSPGSLSTCRHSNSIAKTCMRSGMQSCFFVCFDFSRCSFTRLSTSVYQTCVPCWTLNIFRSSEKSVESSWIALENRRKKIKFFLNLKNVDVTGLDEYDEHVDGICVFLCHILHLKSVSWRLTWCYWLLSFSLSLCLRYALLSLMKTTALQSFFSPFTARMVYLRRWPQPPRCCRVRPLENLHVCPLNFHHA